MTAHAHACCALMLLHCLRETQGYGSGAQQHTATYNILQHTTCKATLLYCTGMDCMKMTVLCCDDTTCKATTKHVTTQRCIRKSIVVEGMRWAFHACCRSRSHHTSNKGQATVSRTPSIGVSVESHFRQAVTTRFTISGPASRLQLPSIALKDAVVCFHSRAELPEGPREGCPCPSLCACCPLGPAQRPCCWIERCGAGAQQVKTSP